jgi:hypothetical protein
VKWDGHRVILKTWEDIKETTVIRLENRKEFVVSG